ncbi:MAG TPA: hypothetical protein ENH43_00595 [Phycisphaerales bacterium]|nr:hypothetical protein [Phycisphaerales bacterium]
MSAQGGNKPSYIWSVNGTRWYIIQSLAGSKILAQMYGNQFTSTWKIPETQFDAEFTEAKDVLYMDSVLGNQPIAGWSSRLLRSDYAGFALNTRRDSDNTNQDIGFVDSYGFDKAAFNAFIAAGNGFNEIWYDQFNANNAANTTHNQQPQISPSGGSNTRPSCSFDGINNRMPANSVVSNYSGNDNPYSFIALVNLNVSSPANIIISASRNSTFAPQMTEAFIAANEYRSNRRDDLSVNHQLNDNSIVNNKYYIVGSMFKNNVFYHVFNDVITTVTVGDLGNLTLDRFTIGGFIKGGLYSPWIGQIDELLVWSGQCGLDDLQAASLNINQFYAVY